MCIAELGQPTDLVQVRGTLTLSTRMMPLFFGGIGPATGSLSARAEAMRPHLLIYDLISAPDISGEGSRGLGAADALRSVARCKPPQS